MDPVLAKRRTNVYDVGPSLNQHRRKVSCSPEFNNRSVFKREINRPVLDETQDRGILFMNKINISGQKIAVYDMEGRDLQNRTLF